jgi:hypothetical protein
VKVYLEVGKKTFASAADWPGWSRAGKTENEALDALLAYAPRYAVAVGLKASALGQLTRKTVDIVERLVGNATTDFGAPGVVPELDRRAVSERELDELVELLRASWATFGRVAAAAHGRSLGPAGPRGGGRSVEKIIDHVAEADRAYVGALGAKAPPARASWHETQRAFVDAIGAKLRGELPERGPRGGKRWPARYAIRRSAWHALDHAWEIEDRLG